MGKSGRRGLLGPAVTRRDFIHDVALGAAGLSLPIGALAAAGPAAADYPPVRTGLRGSHPGAYEIAHALARDGQGFPPGRDLDEHYDLVVVGAGISGLAAAWFHRKLHGPDARILLLDNHDDFGGHARRNEFHQGGPMRLAWGGTVNMEFPKYSDVARGLLDDLGIDIPRLLKDFEFSWSEGSHGLRYGTWFGADRWGRDVLLPGVTVDGLGREELAAQVARFPLSAAAREALAAFLTSEEDLLPGLDEVQRRAWAHRTSYRDFLRACGVPDEATAVLSDATMGYWGVRAENLSVAECLETGMPGAQRLGGLRIGDVGAGDPNVRSAMFPDGNASIARLLVRALIPAAAPDLPPGADPHRIVTTKLDYGQLDRGGSPVRLRLNSTVVNVRHRADGQGVRVSYVGRGEILRVSARQCVMACYNHIVRHLVPELPEAQKEALSRCIKRPMGIINVLLRDGRSVVRSGVMGAYLPGRLCQSVRLVWGVNAGGYEPAWRPEDPVVIQFYGAIGAPEPDGLTIAEQNKAGRQRLLDMSFEDYEREVVTVLEGVFGAGGFDAAREVRAIIVNRWPHGYARDHLDLEDPAWNADPPPNVVGRQRFGAIAIANSDAGADAYTHTAIDQAWRAVNELRA